MNLMHIAQKFEHVLDTYRWPWRVGPGRGSRGVAQGAAGSVDYLKGEKEAYMTEDMPVARVELILNRLLELLHDKEMARGALDRFKETEHPLRPPKNLQICAPFSNFTNATGNTRKT